MCKIETLNNTRRFMSIYLKNGKILRTDDFFDHGKRYGKFSDKELIIFNETLKRAGYTKEDVKEWHVIRLREKDILYISNHAFQRLKERNNWNKKTSMRMLEKVWESGNRKDEISGPVRQWIDYRINKSIGTKSEGITYVIYGNTAYLFMDKTLVTVLNIPNNKKIINLINGRDTDIEDDWF